MTQDPDSTKAPPDYHAGSRALQDRFDGRRLADVLRAKLWHTAFTEADKAVIEAAPFFFLATAAQGAVDCSFKGGPPGFVRVIGADQLEFPDYDGNSMYLSLGNIVGSPTIGMLFMRFDGKSQRLRVRGRAEVIDDRAQAGFVAGARRMVRVTAEAIFPNCPRYIPDLATGQPSAYLPTEEGSLKPAWKSVDWIAPSLPHDDPHAAE